MKKCIVLTIFGALAMLGMIMVMAMIRKTEMQPPKGLLPFKTQRKPAIE